VVTEWEEFFAGDEPLSDGCNFCCHAALNFQHSFTYTFTAKLIFLPKLHSACHVRIK